jgi:hypothetical protein
VTAEDRLGAPDSLSVPLRFARDLDVRRRVARQHAPRDGVEACFPDDPVDVGHCPGRDAYQRLHDAGVYIYQTCPGYDGPDSYVEPPAGWGVLVQADIVVHTADGCSATIIRVHRRQLHLCMEKRWI